MAGITLEEALRMLSAVAAESRVPAARAIDELIGGYLLPRLADSKTPQVVVVMGSTGSGKSMLLSSLAGREISPIGPTRPTTSRPVAWCHQSRERWCQALLQDAEIVGDTDVLLDDLVLVDTPDLDSRLTSHRDQALGLLGKADGVLLATTPQRYADLAFLTAVSAIDARRLPCVVVMNRMARDRRAALTDMVQLWRRQGFTLLRSTRDVLIVNEQRTHDRLLPPPTVAELRAELAGLAGTEMRASAFAGTLRRVLDLAREVELTDVLISGRIGEAVTVVEGALRG